MRNLNGQNDPVVKQRRLLNRLVRNLVAYTGGELADIAAKPRKAPQPKRRRVLFRRSTDLTDADLQALIREIGADRLMSALDRWTQPSLSLEAAE